ncbi:unnamed protein product [Lymnaea stagnalis]|uniref:Uncharacterized protein n=1 Tax=Lymnaea stagnalis TaxID=6523 RepID=A0AAV2IF94_LYMST
MAQLQDMNPIKFGQMETSSSSIEGTVFAMYRETVSSVMSTAYSSHYVPVLPSTTEANDYEVHSDLVVALSCVIAVCIMALLTILLVLLLTSYKKTSRPAQVSPMNDETEQTDQ